MKAVGIFKALGDVNRVRALWALQNQALCACQLVELLALAPSTVSKHMNILIGAALVVGQKQGRWVYYRLVEPREDGTSKILALLPLLFQAEPQLHEDQHKLQEILKLDPEALCRLQSERSKGGTS